MGWVTYVAPIESFILQPNRRRGMPANLKDLVVDEEEIDQELLTEILTPHVRITKQAGRPVFTPQFSSLSSTGKILVYLLARRAAVKLGLTKEPPQATPKEISDATGVKYGTVKPAVVGLARQGLLSTQAGKYSVSGHALLKAKEAIS